MSKSGKILLGLAMAILVLGTWRVAGAATVATAKCRSGQTIECTLGPLSTSAACTCCGDCQLSDAIRFFVMFIQFALGISGALAFLMFTYGGFMMLISAGESARVQEGRKILTSTVTAIIIIFGAWTIVNFMISSLSGASFTEVAAQGGKWWEVK